MKYQLLLVILAFTIIGQTQAFKFSKYSDLVNQIKLHKNDILVGIVTSSNYLCGRCREAEDKIEEFIESADGLAKIFIMDCEKEKENQNLKAVCDEGNNLPHITFFEQQGDDLSKQWPLDTGYNGAVSGPHLLNFMEQISFNAVKEIDTLRKHRNFLDDKEKPLKMIYFTESELTPLVIKVLSVQNRDNIAFAQVDSDNEKMRKKHEKFTGNQSLLFLSYNGVKKAYEETHYTGDLENIKEINQFIQQQISKSEVKIKQSTVEETLKMMEIKNLKINKFNTSKLDTDFWVLYHLYETGNPDPNFEKIKNEYGAFFSYYQSELTCNKCKQTALNNFGIKEFPAIIAYPQGQKEMKDFIKIGEESTDELNEIFLKYTKQTEKVLKIEDPAELNSVYKESLDAEQLPVIWYYDTEDKKQTLFMHTLSYMNRYKKPIRFFRHPDPSDETKEKWTTLQRGITTQLPQIFVTLAVTGETTNRSTGFNSERDFFNYIVFLDGLVQNKFEIKMKRTEIKEVNEPKIWDEECRAGTSSCLVGMLSVHREAKFTREMEQFKELKEAFPKKKVKWVWADGYCREEILKSVGLSPRDLPTLIYYDNNKGKFKTLEGKWGKENNEKFVQSIRRKNSKYENVRDELEMGDRKCKEFNMQQSIIYEAVKSKKRELQIEAERKRNKKFYENQKIEYDEDEGDDGLDQYGMKRDRPGRDHDDL